MGIFKLVLVAVVLWLVYRLFKTFKSTDTKKNTSKINKIIACCECDLHIPVNQAVFSNNKYYCQQHRPK
ncbi:hypothetical protein MNB_SUP05-5-585 [hydrothermal vent metagenome]|uniref:Uncharacterized protein n=1 Tax=hydrothermal vent metagenome TaxID=652676 RepID=A0A1W1CJQ7_9ZZZZ